MIMVSPFHFNLIEEEFSNCIVMGIKELLEHKHLYQSIKISYPQEKIIFERLKQARKDDEFQQEDIEELKLILSNVEDFSWEIRSPLDLRHLPYLGGVPERIVPSVNISPHSIKTYCSRCKSIQPYNYKHGLEISLAYKENYETRNPNNSQVFALAFECQSCKSFPEVFLIRREKMKLILSGRAPIEEVDIPKSIPKTFKRFFSDAIVAFNSGQILAGKFLLRTFIEQYIRDFSNDNVSQDIDSLFDEYNKSLPDDFKARFPSLSSIYSQLSTDIHEANESEDLFSKAKKEIEEHFEAKKLFRIE